MLSEGDRLRMLRKALDIKQGEFAEKISTTQGHISDIENDRKNLSDRTIKLICLENWNGKTVNEEWLRTGEGEMFVPLTRSEAIAEFAGSLMKEEDASFKKRLVEALAKLNEQEWEVLEGIARKLTEPDQP